MIKQRKLKSAIIIGLIGGFIFILLIVIGMISSFISYNNYTKINHFDDISECLALDDFKVNGDNLVDNYISDINYIDSYVYKLNCNNTLFEMYAYEFDSIDTAKKYYLQIEGKTVDGNIDYNGNSSLFSSSLIVRYNTNIYRIKTGGTNDYVEVMHCLNSIFTVNIRE